MTQAALEHYHIVRCSPELRSATIAVEAWGRARWPEARVMHELRVGGCRIDIAFVLPEHLVGVEIKSEKDTLDRLRTQMRDYLRELPEVWVAVAPKWIEKVDALSDFVSPEIPWGVGRVIIEGGEVQEVLSAKGYVRKHGAHVNLMLTAGMLHLLWRSEVAPLAAQYGIRIPARLSLSNALPILARKLTGDQIVAGVCTALRAREKTGGYAADPTPPPARGRDACDGGGHAG